MILCEFRHSGKLQSATSNIRLGCKGLSAQATYLTSQSVRLHIVKFYKTFVLVKAGLKAEKEKSLCVLRSPLSLTTKCVCCNLQVLHSQPSLMFAGEAR